MFAVAYYVTTSTCLFGANALKRKALIQQPVNASSNDMKKKSVNGSRRPPELSIATSVDQLTNKQNIAGQKFHKKQVSGNKRGNESRNKAVNGSGGSISNTTSATNCSDF